MSSAQARVSLSDGSWVELGVVLAKAGEGTIYRLANRAGLVAKVFHPDLANLDEKIAKVSAMVGTVPPGAVQNDGFVVLAWPQQLVYRAGMPVGFLMPRIDTAQAVEIHSLSNPAHRSNPLPSAPQWTTGVSWTHLVTAAANLCLAVDVVHHVDAVIGDFQERNILVDDTMRVTLVDCDSMQFTGSDRHQYLSPLGRPEFTAPELASVDLRNTARNKTSDLFALAVHIHLLIMAGNHPFLRGAWTGTGDQPDALTLARQGHWAGGPGSLLQTHPLAPPVDFLPNEIQAMFTRAFTDGARDPGSRPSAAEWREHLQRIQVASCGRGHQIPVETKLCPWCRIEEIRAVRRSGRTTQTVTATSQTAIPVAAQDRSAGPAVRTASGNRWPEPFFQAVSRYPGTTRRPWQRPAIIVALASFALFITVVGLSVVMVRSEADKATSATNITQSTAKVSTSRSAPTTTTVATTTTAPQATESHYTIVDYIRDNGIVEVPITRGATGAPMVVLPPPPGWEDAGTQTPEWAYVAIVATDPAYAADPPTIIGLLSKLSDNTNPAKILEYAPNEIKNLSGYQGAQRATSSTLSGFDAVQIGGTYIRDGVRRAIAQKTVVIPAQYGLYVLQLNADGLESHLTTLMDATSFIDDNTTITR